MYPQSYDAENMEEAYRTFIVTYKHRGEHIYQTTLNDLGYMGGTLTVDFHHLYDHSPELAVYTIENPKKALVEFKAAAGGNRIHITNLVDKSPIRALTSMQLNKLSLVEGIVVKVAQETSKISRACYECQTCGERYMVEQEYQYLSYPDGSCPSCKTKSWRLDTENSEYVDCQYIEIQEPPNQLPPGDTPQKLEVELLEELVGNASPGDQVHVTGTVKVRMRSPMSRSLELERYMIANHVKVINKESAIAVYTDKQIQELKKLAEDPFIMNRIVNSIAPSIYGHTLIKKALALQQFGAPPVIKPDVRKRGDIHIGLIGDPGTSKSQLLLYAAKLSHRGVYSMGKGASAAGLTATVAKDKHGGFTLEVGSLVIADTGHASIDELEKMRDDDREAIHPAMEQQIISINKAGINTILNTRCSILAAANPTAGRYNPYVTVAQNLSKLPVTLLNRFDLIFIMRDLPDSELDHATAETILEIAETDGYKPIPFETLRAYIAYARTLTPRLNKRIAERIRNFYVKVRQAYKERDSGGEGSAPIPITPRQLESVIRLTKAHARAHLRETTRPEDVDAAINLFERSMEQVGIDPYTGQTDIDLIELGQPRSLQDKLMYVLKIIHDMEREMDVVRVDDLISELVESHGYTESETIKMIGVLMRDGRIYSPRPNYYKTTD